MFARYSTDATQSMSQRGGPERDLEADTNENGNEEVGRVVYRRIHAVLDAAVKLCVALNALVKALRAVGAAYNSFREAVGL